MLYTSSPPNTCRRDWRTYVPPQWSVRRWKAGPLFHRKDRIRIVPPASDVRLSVKISFQNPCIHVSRKAKECGALIIGPHSLVPLFWKWVPPCPSVSRTVLDLRYCRDNPLGTCRDVDSPIVSRASNSPGICCLWRMSFQGQRMSTHSFRLSPVTSTDPSDSALQPLSWKPKVPFHGLSEHLPWCRFFFCSCYSISRFSPSIHVCWLQGFLTQVFRTYNLRSGETTSKSISDLWPKTFCTKYTNEHYSVCHTRSITSSEVQ